MLLEIFFIATTVISLVFNIIQWQKDKIAYIPYNILLGLYNNVNYKMQRGWDKRAVFQAHPNREAIEYCNEVVYGLRGFHEQVVPSRV